MAGDGTEFLNLAERLLDLHRQLSRTSDPNERMILSGKFDALKAEMAEFRVRLRRRAKAGDREAGEVLDAIETVAATTD